MRTAHLFRSTVLLCAALLSAGLALAEDIQSIHPTGYVTDLAGVIGAQKKAALQALGTELEQKTGAQMAIVTVRSLDGESERTVTIAICAPVFCSSSVPRACRAAFFCAPITPARSVT